MSEEVTPVFAQYLSLKSEHPGEVLFFRLGDFYEMFNDDAVEVSKILNLTLTHRAGNPMCGIPYHAAKIYIARLLRVGKKIAIAEQIGEIAKKGLTERKVIEVITPGTACETEYLNGGANNFLASACIVKNTVAFSYIDITTGEFKATSFPLDTLSENLPKEFGRVSPREILLPSSMKDNSFVQKSLETLSNISVSYYPDWNFNAETAYNLLTKQFQTANLKSFSLTKESPEIIPAGFLLDYIAKNANAENPHVSEISVYNDSEYVIIDDSSRRNLEIISNIRDGSSQFTLLECVNNTKTAMGGRLIREWLSFPLTDIEKINKRLSHTEAFASDISLLKSTRDKLNGILDIERLAARIAMDRAHAKDLQALRQSISLWLTALETLSEGTFIFSETDTAVKIAELIQNSILDDPATTYVEGRIIRDGWSEDLDHWRNVQKNFHEILEEYLEEEKEKTGIPNLKIKSNGNMGYYIEVTRGKMDMVPPHFIMRRTLVNADRYTTEKLQELEKDLNESGARILELEHDLFIEVRNELKKYVLYLQKMAQEIAYVDVTSAFAESAVMHGWTKPELLKGNRVFDVENGRHPVVELHLPKGEFVPNSLALCSGQKGQDESFALITGPNMAGKSTFLRQNALITLLAQTGSYVPASKAVIGIADRIFCRVGASDNLARGESTFLVEMTETARILRSATESSLVIMDEVGRGTSTEDGLSIAWAVSEYLLNEIKCRTLFATHYHELTRLEHPSVRNLCMAVKENEKGIVFLRKVISGSSANSYGIHVANLAGVPKEVIERASEILCGIQDKSPEKTSIPETKTESLREAKKKESLDGFLFSEEEMVVNEILSIDTDNLTPMQALQNISRWKKELMNQQ